MPTPTYTPLASLTLSASAASVTFSSISQAYRDLVLVVSGAISSGGESLRLRFNGDTGANYSYAYMAGTGTATESSSSPSNTFIMAFYNESTSTMMTGSIMDYSATDKHKSVLFRGDNASARTMATAGRWANTAAITSIVVFPQSATWTAGSSFSLYGIVA